jgi:hypothetical protein
VLRRPDREAPVCESDFAGCALPDGLERRESDLFAPESVVPELPAPEWAVLERLADDPPCEAGVAFVPESGVLARPLPPPPGLDAVGAGEPAGAGEEAGPADTDLGETGPAMADNVRTESAAMGDRPT